MHNENIKTFDNISSHLELEVQYCGITTLVALRGNTNQEGKRTREVKWQGKEGQHARKRNENGMQPWMSNLKR